jgi:hypothetical protein
MPLPPSPTPRRRLHRRCITYEGYLRDDGLFDVDAHLVDAKDHDFVLFTGVRPAREAVHDMWARVTIDRAFVIRAIDVSTDAMPYPDACDRIEPVYAKLVGANLVQGFRKRLHDDMGGVRGCTHVTELLGALPSAAVQMFAGLRREDEGEHKPFQLDHCHALETTTDTVRRYYPRWYRGGGAGSDGPGDPIPRGGSETRKDPPGPVDVSSTTQEQA